MNDTTRTPKPTPAALGSALGNAVNGGRKRGWNTVTREAVSIINSLGRTKSLSQAGEAALVGIITDRAVAAVVRLRAADTLINRTPDCRAFGPPVEA